MFSAAGEQTVDVPLGILLPGLPGVCVGREQGGGAYGREMTRGTLDKSHENRS